MSGCRVHIIEEMRVLFLTLTMGIDSGMQSDIGGGGRWRIDAAMCYLGS